MAKGTSFLQKHDQPINYRSSPDCKISAKITQNGFELRLNYPTKMIAVLMSDIEARQLVKMLLGGGPVTFKNFNFEGIADENDDIIITSTEPVEILIDSKMNYQFIPDFVPSQLYDPFIFADDEK
jgi:hypothetical protein